MSRIRKFFQLLPAALVVSALSFPLVACDNGPSLEDDALPTSPTTSPVTETFSTQLIVGGSASRTFNAAKNGTAVVTLASLGSATKLGFGIGVPDVFGSSCLFTRSSETAVVGTSFSIAVDAGTYCVRVFDVGGMTSTLTFSVTIVRP